VRRRIGRTANPVVSQEMLDCAIEYATVNLKHYGPLTTLFNGTMEYVALAKHSLQATDRLGNPEINFPIAVVYGDFDFLGSDGGAEEIVKKSKYFASGESQLFKLKRSGHNMMW
jgi:pimeloyl-ACP methyl ester carboxylesterase